jgi:hypothetical protein
VALHVIENARLAPVGIFALHLVGRVLRQHARIHQSLAKEIGKLTDLVASLLHAREAVGTKLSFEASQRLG